MSSVQDIFKKCGPWMRLSICVNIHIKRSLINVLHNHIKEPQVQALPSDPADLYAFLQTNKKKIQNSKVIKEQQKSILLPASGQTVDSSSFDISLTRFLIQTFCGIRNAKKDWKEPDPTDQTICAYVYRAASMRNAICHDNNIERLNATEFERRWKQLKEILQGLKYVEDIEPFKTETLDIEKYEHVILKEFVDHLQSYKKGCLNEPSQDDYIQRQFYVEGNENDIVTELDLENLIKDNDRLVIYGEAGLGKSSTARRLKKEWCNTKILNGNHLLYFDSKRMNKLLKVQSNAAPLYFSELGDYLRKIGRTEDDLSIYNCVKTTINDLVILIDGIDEFPVREFVNESYVDELEKKVKNNESISANETISAIYFGFLFPYSKVLLLGRIGEFESLNKVKIKRAASILNQNRRTKNLQLLKFDEVDVKDFACLKICKHQPSQGTICTDACLEIYNEIKNIELCKIPTDLNSLIEIHKKHPSKDIGKITRTKLLIATLLNRLNEHVNQKNYIPCETFGEIIQEKSTFIDCIRTLGEISFNAVYKGDITIKAEKETINGVVYFQFENLIKVKRVNIEELDFFYIRDFVYYLKLEPHHTLNIEFLSACYLFSHPDELDSILKLSKDRQLVIINFIAGLHEADPFTKDFVKTIYNITAPNFERFCSWLYDVEDVRERLPNGGHFYDYWYGLIENQKLSPSLFLLDSISQEVELPKTFIPKTIVSYFDNNHNEWYNMKYLKHDFLTKLSDKSSINLFLKEISKYDFIMKGNIWIYSDHGNNQLDQFINRLNNRLTLRINRLGLNRLNASLDSLFNSNLNSNSLQIGGWSSSMLDMVLNALSPPATHILSNIPRLTCKKFEINDIPRFNLQQIEILFRICLSCVVDYISIYPFFTDEQIDILEIDERKYTNEMINIELNNEYLNRVFKLPNLGKRHISLSNLKNITNKNVIKYKKYISTGYSKNFANYKIIKANIPFVRKMNYSPYFERSMYLNFYEIDFAKISSKVFATTFSLIPSLAFEDNDYYISSSKWRSLAEIEDCRINELRIWDPKSPNFEHFLNIKTNVIQFNCKVRDELKELLDHIVKNPSVQLDKEIKVLVIKYDEFNWDFYEEIPLFGNITIEEYKNNYISYDLQLDDICLPFHEGEKHLKWWCCEISMSYKKNINLVTTFSDDDYNMTSYC